MLSWLGRDNGKGYSASQTKLLSPGGSFARVNWFFCLCLCDRGTIMSAPLTTFGMREDSLQCICFFCFFLLLLFAERHPDFLSPSRPTAELVSFAEKKMFFALPCEPA